MPGALEADAAFEGGSSGDAVPLLVRQRDEPAADDFQEAGDLGGVVGDAEAVGVFEDEGQEFCGGFAAQDRAVEACGQECGDAADMVEVDVGDDQGLDAGDVEADGGGLGVARGCVGALFEAAVDQQAGGGVEVELVAGAGDAAGAAVV